LAWEALEEGVGDEDVAEPGGEAEDGGVDHGAVGSPDEDLADADAVTAGEGEQVVAEGAGAEGDGLPDAAEDGGHGDEEGCGADELDCAEGPRGSVGADGGFEAVARGALVGPVQQVVPGEQEQEWDEDEGDLIAQHTDGVARRAGEVGDVFTLVDAQGEGGRGQA